MKSRILKLSHHSYPIYFNSASLFEGLSSSLSKSFPKAKRLIYLTNPTLEKLYGGRLKKELKSLASLQSIVVPEGEKYKTLKTVSEVYSQLASLKLDRQTPLIALGGGVVGDLSGFIAATYLRGVPYVQIPTSLLAQVDSSVGGKTGVDLPAGKNLVGAFYHPHLVYIDLNCLATLPKPELLCGLAEVIKYAAIQDKKLFETLQKKRELILAGDEATLLPIVKTCVDIKACIVEKDEKETSGLRALLNFGHTLGHAIETKLNYSKINHGQAVAIGMAFAAYFSSEMGFCAQTQTQKLLELIRAYQLPSQVSSKYQAYDFIQLMKNDKKMLAGKIRYVLLKELGEAFLKELEFAEVQKNLSRWMKES